jgi:molybdopterin-guanine dinucleotide biosynthesis protein A
VTSGEHASRCAVLIGGAGSRLGGDKHLRELGGEPLAWWVLDAARHAHLEPLLVAKHGTPLGRLAGECEVLIEKSPDRHPLIGVIAALEQTGEPLVVAPCDVPLVPAALLRRLAEASGPTIVSGPGGTEPLLGRFEPASLELLGRTVAAGASARAAVAQLGAAEIGAALLEQHGDPASYLRNLNTPDELGILDRELSLPEVERPARG